MENETAFGLFLLFLGGALWVFRRPFIRNNATSTFERTDRRRGHIPTERDWQEARIIIYGSILLLLGCGSYFLTAGFLSLPSGFK